MSNHLAASIEPLAGAWKLSIDGDVVANNIVSFENPQWHFGFDTEPEIALTNSSAMLDKAANEKIRMLGCRWTYRGVGYVKRMGRRIGSSEARRFRLRR
ncbi:hypothetical protein [Rhizobium tubonense]|uniref:hypothetical protein n=1 Tax=Rhizobium tubonense TaxID=484088 RepID=UPI001FCEB19D|nr:hypothetical protein [Rhizobium tubonense]